MARKYSKVEHLVGIIEKRSKAGETYREIGVRLGLTREEVRGAMHRHHAKERKLAAGYIPRPKGRPRKEPASEEVKRNNEIVQLRMQVELLRNFLCEAGRRCSCSIGSLTDSVGSTVLKRCARCLKYPAAGITHGGKGKEKEQRISGWLI